MRADLHCHTTLSNGSLGIEEVIAQAKRNKIDVLSITDHDSLASTSRAVILGQRYGIRVLPAVEISAGEEKSMCCAICRISRIGWRGCVSAAPKPASSAERQWL